MKRKILDNLSLPVLCLVSLGIVSIVILAAGGNPYRAFSALVNGCLGNKYSISESFIRMCPLLLAGLGVALAFRAGVWNIGAEGQLYLGALGATAIAPFLASLPAVVAIPVASFVAFMCGSFWAIISAYLRTRRGVQEVISTIMLNFIAIQVVSWAVHGPFRESTGQFPYSNEIPLTMNLPIIIDATRFHLGIVLAFFITGLIWFYLYRTIGGFHIRAVGSAPQAVEYSGVNLERVIWRAMIISGGLAGLAGGFELMGVSRILFENFSPGYGYTAIAVALLGRLSPIGILASSFIFGALQAGSGAIQREAGIDAVVVGVVQGLIVLAVALQAARSLGLKTAILARGAEEV